MAQKREKEDSGDQGEDPNYDPEAEVIDSNMKKVDLPEIAVVTGEQEDDIVAKYRTKMYRWRNQWKERGVGELKILKHKKSGLIRLLVRAQKTHKIIANHLLQKKEDLFCNLQPMKTSNNAWTWAAYDTSDQKPQTQKFCAKFTSKEEFQKFKEDFDKACEQNKKWAEKNKEKQQESPKLEEVIQKKQ